MACHKTVLQFLFFLSIASFFMTSCSKPQPSLHNQLKNLVDKHDAAGLAVVVVKDSEILFEDNLGYKDVEEQIPLEKGDLFRIASISKSFTATALMQLVEKDSLHLEDDVSDLIGFKIRNPNYPDTPITLRMIMSHSSSLNDSQGYFSLNTINPDSTDTAGSSYNDYEPGTAYEYCNLNYNLAGAILEKWSKTRFDQYITRHILIPLDITGGYDVDSLDRSKFAKLYTYDEKQGRLIDSPEAYQSISKRLKNYKKGYDTPVFSPTGGMKISARDLARYMTMHMNYGTFENSQILKKESDQLMQTPVIEINDDASYGLALFKVKNLIPGKTMIGHTGDAYGLYSSMFFDPEEKIGFVAITNGIKEDGQEEHEFSPILKSAINLLYKNFKDSDSNPSNPDL